MDKQTYYSFNPWWEGKEFATKIPRLRYLNQILKRLKRPQVEIIIGSRRIGKTTLLKQIVKQLLLKKINQQKIFYLSCDHPQAIGITISQHFKFFRQLFNHSPQEKLYLFLDEVQESPEWQKELKMLYDLENLKIFCSGSTSALIKSHGGKLTGRQINTLIFPLSFDEFLRFKGIKTDVSQGYLLEKTAESYLQLGGYPENVLQPSEEYLAALLDDIFLRDLVRLYPIKNLNIVKDLFKLLSAGVGSRTSYNNLAKVLGLSLDTVKNYIDHLESAFLVKSLARWSTSYKQRIYSQKKFYLFDTGLKTLITGKQDLGFKAENAVFMHLLRQKLNLGYFAESQKEVDFIVEKQKTIIPVEVKYTEAISLKDKKLAGLLLFLKRHPQIKKVVVVTKSLEQETKYQKTKIIFIPLWQFLLELPPSPLCFLRGFGGGLA